MSLRRPPPSCSKRSPKVPTKVLDFIYDLVHILVLPTLGVLSRAAGRGRRVQWSPDQGKSHDAIIPITSKDSSAQLVKVRATLPRQNYSNICCTGYSGTSSDLTVEDRSVRRFQKRAISQEVRGIGIGQRDQSTSLLLFFIALRDMFFRRIVEGGGRPSCYVRGLQ